MIDIVTVVKNRVRMRPSLDTAVLICSIAALGAGQSNEAQLHGVLKARVDAGKNIGIVAGIVDADGKKTIAAYGNSGPGSLPLDADSVFEIGSITKVFTAILLADMADRGEVRLDDPVAKHLPPGVRVPERNGRKITLLDLTTQSSGLPRMPDNLRPKDMANPYADYTPEMLFEFLGRYQLQRDIGADYEYSNLGVGLLGQALTYRAGKSYEALVKERILDPLKMEHTGIALSPWMKAHLARGHDARGEVTANWDIPAFAGAGALRSTMHDMIRFARANLDPSGGRLQRVMQQTHEVRHAAGSASMSIGMGWHIRHMDGRDVVWHNGGTGGYRTWLGFDTSRKTAAIVLTNSALGNDDLGFDLVGPVRR